VTPDEPAIREVQRQIVAQYDQLRLMQRHASVHLSLGVLATLSVVLVNSISVTYFIGTGRWCMEVTEAYHLEPEWTRQSTKLKRRSFAWALWGVFTAVGIAALGAAADPGTLRAGTADWVLPHATAAIVGTILISHSLYVQFLRIAENHAVIREILAQVRQKRSERGLEAEAE
jgi:hypothetical protein